MLVLVLFAPPRELLILIAKLQGSGCLGLIEGFRLYGVWDSGHHSFCGHLIQGHTVGM